MERLRDRFDALQKDLMQLYEQDSNKLQDQIKLWGLQRQESALMYYARQKGLGSLGQQALPALVVSENSAKNAIMMELYLKNLQKSIFGGEPWTMSETSLETFLAPPKHTFKKGPYVVTVQYDGDPDNANEYPNWEAIYYQDMHDIWHKAVGSVSSEGLYYRDHTGHHQYFVRFADDAARYSDTGTWEVVYKNNTISSVASTAPWGPGTRHTAGPSSRVPAESGHSSPSPTSSPRGRGGYADQASAKTPERRRQGAVPRTPRTPVQRRRRQRKSTPRRPKGGSWPSPAEVGRGSRLVAGPTGSRLARLQAEARDPPVILLKGPSSNHLKCWRNRCKRRHKHLYEAFSTIFQWLYYSAGLKHRMLIAFTDEKQRQKFLDTVKLPKNTEYSLGNLNSL